MKKNGNKMTKDTIPQNFTMSLVLVDALPVLFFAASMVAAGFLLKSGLFLVGALLCLWAGAAKVIWKVIVVLKKRNIWWLFLQMRIVMPVGFLLMAAGLAANRKSVDFAALWSAAVSAPAVFFFAVGLLGMALMLVFAFRLDSSDVRANWLEQLTNGAAQAAFFVGILLLTLR